VLYYSKGMLPSVVLNVGVQLFSAAAFHRLEGWRFSGRSVTVVE
jgi:hypothetical protein